MNQQALLDPYTKEASERGCHCCQNRVHSCYVVDFRFLPTRFVRKRHRDREQKVILCRSCYETADFLPVLIGGRSCPLQTSGVIMGPESVICLGCSLPAFPTKGLFGVISSSLWFTGRCIKSIPLAFFCSACVERKLVTFVDGNLIQP